MRTLENALITVNILSLMLGFRKQPRGVWLAALGANLGIFILHETFEGLRYQLTFSYIFVILFTIYAFAKISGRFDYAHLPRAIKVSAMGLSLVLLGLTGLLATALPVFSLPQPTGSYAVGVQYLHLTDTQRDDPFLDKSSRKRELMVKVYYPAQPDASKAVDRYFHGSSALVRQLAAFYNMPSFAFDQLTLVKTHSKEGLAIADQQQRYPLILFSHGAGASMEVHSAQGEDLASHGYIVVVIDHTYVSFATAFPERLVTHHEATTDFHTPEPVEIITQIMAQDAQFVLDQFEAMNAGKVDSVFQGRLNMDQIGAMGHSVGGAVAYNLAINDSRVKVAVNLDGVVYITPKAGAQGIPPLLMLANDQYHVQAIEARQSLMENLDEVPQEDRDFLISIYGGEAVYRATYARSLANVSALADVLAASGSLYIIQGCDHMKFTDLGLFIGARPLREAINIRGDAEPARCLEVTRALTLAFFDQHLKGEGSTLESVPKQYAELKRVYLSAR